VGHGSNFRLTLPRRAGAELTGSPLPLEPNDVHRPVGADDSGDKTTTHLLRPTPPPVTLRGIGQPRPADTTTPGTVRG
jgi:two-component system sensor histidine kinase MtrB